MCCSNGALIRETTVNWDVARLCGFATCRFFSPPEQRDECASQ